MSINNPKWYAFVLAFAAVVPTSTPLHAQDAAAFPAQSPTAWTLDQALAEMRERGHVWKKFLKPGATYSWHEEHLRAVASKMPAAKSFMTVSSSM